MSVFDFIIHLWNTLFHAAKEAWNKLPAASQQALLNGSGILNIINQYADQDPALVVATITANYPNEKPELIYDGLVAILKNWGALPAVVPSDLAGVVSLAQKYLKGLESGVWPAIIHGAAQLLALVLSGGSTPFEIIASLLQFVYSTFVKNTPITLAVTPNPAPAANQG